MTAVMELLREGDYSGAALMLIPGLGKILIAFLIFIIGRKLIKWLKKFIVKSVTPRLEPGIAGFLQSAAGIILNLVLIFAIVEYLGFSTASLVTVLGSAGLAIGLALQGSLSNLAGGVLILVNKPFTIGDYIVVGNLEGTVTNIGICYTKLNTVDNRVVVLPNGNLSNNNLVNVSAEPKRRIDLVVPISYDDDIRTVRNVLTDIAGSQPKVLADEPVEVYTKEFGDDSIQILYRFWVKREDYWEVYFGTQEKIRYAFLEKGISIPFRQVDVTIKNPEGNAGKKTV